MADSFTTQQFGNYTKGQLDTVRKACADSPTPETDRKILDAAYNLYEAARHTPRLMNGSQLSTLGAKALLGSQLMPDQLLPAVADPQGSPLKRQMTYDEAMRRLNGKDDQGGPDRPLANRLAATLTRIMEDDTLRANIGSAAANNVCWNVEHSTPLVIVPASPSGRSR